jgi:hypothetical protein
MRKSVCSIAQGIIAAFLLPLPLHAAEFAGGTGEPNDPYQIATAEQLVSIGSDPNLLDRHYVLLNDVDLDPNLPGGRIFTRAVIAPDTGREADTFTGSFDGRGREIRHLTIRANGASRVGLFGCIGRQGVVRDLRIVDADAKGAQLCGALAGMNKGCVRRCYARARVSGSFVGVLVGYNGEGEIVDCRAEGEVTGRESFGGLVGENGWEGTILNSYTSSRVVSRQTGDRWIGGFVGRNWGTLVNCCATGEVSTLAGTEAVGGLAGANHGGSIVNCHATGSVSATQGRRIGGLVGENAWFVVHSYATGNVSGGTSMHGLQDGEPVASGALGDLVGWNDHGNIYACYASGDVTGGDGSRNLGGLVGSQGGDVVDSYCVGRVRAGENSAAVGGLAGGGASGTTGCLWDIEASGLTPVLHKTVTSPCTRPLCARYLVQIPRPSLDLTKSEVQKTLEILAKSLYLQVFSCIGAPFLCNDRVNSECGRHGPDDGADAGCGHVPCGGLGLGG